MSQVLKLDQPNDPKTAGVPQVIAVDLDGTLTPTDTLVEAILNLARRSPQLLLRFALTALTRGKAAAKVWLAQRVSCDPAALPYNEELLTWLKVQQQNGRTLVLATASHESVGIAVAQHLGIFSEVIGSRDTNLSGERKAAVLDAKYGAAGYVYAGNAAVDLRVWAKTGRAIVVNARPAVLRKAENLFEVERVFERQKIDFRTLRRVLRIHQWSKNLLLFAPLLLAHSLAPESWLRAVFAFFAYSLCASSAYIMNDLLDLPDDRQHPDKRRRPFASGRFSVFWGLGLMPLLLVCGLGIAFALGLDFGLVLVSYYVATLAYSLSLKRKPLLDVFCLASLYTWRIFAGSVATGTKLSEWLMAFSIFAFLSLAMVKRCSELKSVVDRGESKVSGRGYRVDDIALVETFGAATACTAVLILALYIASPDVVRLYSHAKRLMLLCPVILFWFVRVWLLTHRRRMNSDPIVFALNDRVTYLIAMIVIFVGWLAT